MSSTRSFATRSSRAGSGLPGPALNGVGRRLCVCSGSFTKQSKFHRNEATNDPTAMDSAKSVLQSILLATQRVRNATTRYSTTTGVRQVGQHSLVRLELEFQTIADASSAFLQVFDNPLLRRQYMLDDRLMDWLSGPEPETCLETLIEMKKLLNTVHEVQAFSGFTPTRSRFQEDDINTAIVLFYTQKAHFHFLLTTDIW